MTAPVLRAKKLKGPGKVRAAAAHNKRAIQAEIGANGSIDASLSHLNESLMGEAAPESVAAMATTMMRTAGIDRLRFDAVRAIEFVVSLPRDHGIDDRAFFLSVADWIGARFGGTNNILSADIHRDEPQTHAHYIVLPLIGGRMVGSDALGGRKKLAEMLSAFHRDVCSLYGFDAPARKLRGTAREEAAAQVIKAMKSLADPALRSAAWPAIRDSIESDPAPYSDALGLPIPEAPRRRLRSMAAIFTSTGKGSQVPERQCL